MDFGGRNLGYLSKLPHTGGVVYADDENKLSELKDILQGIIDERKVLFAKNNCGTFVDYRAISQNSLPAILVLIDNYASFRDKYIDIADSFTDIISSGQTFGVYFVITGSTRNSIYYKVTEQISTYFTLKMNDPSNYMDIHNMRPPVIPEDISGRGITVMNKEIVEFQIAIAYDCTTEAERIESISQQYIALASDWHGELPISLELPSNDLVGSSDLTEIKYWSMPQSNLPEPIRDDYGSLVLGSSKSGALTYGITLLEDYKVCVCANDSGQFRKIYNVIIRNSVQYSNRHILFIDDGKGTFNSLIAQFPTVRYIRNTSDLDILIEELKPELNTRLEALDKAHDQIFIIISDFNQFFDMITDEQAMFMRKVCVNILIPHNMKFALFAVSM